MDEQPIYYRPLSLHLSRTLDKVGLNEKTVQHRRQHVLKEEKIYTVFNNNLLKECNVKLYTFGSRSEGTLTPGLNSDVDSLYCLETLKVIQDWSEWQHDHVNLLMLHEDTAPGYCRLQVLRSDMPLPIGRMPNEHCAYDSYRVILMNTCVHTAGNGTIRNGPADSSIGEWGIRDTDTVYALRCSKWPPYAAQWIHRRRRGHWPTQQIFEQATKDGIFLVAVGYKFSQTPELEWRISFSSTERRLMFSMNMAQLKCYVVLKMLMKSFVTPHVIDSISSYHCKTAMFYSIEETGSEYWREDNLVECIVKCLRLLLTWVNRGFCPHFIIPETNLFAGKVTQQNKRRVQSVLEDLIQSNGRYLMCIPTDSLGHMLHISLGTRPSQIQTLDSLQTMEVLLENEFVTVSASERCRTGYLVRYAALDVSMHIQYVYQSIHELRVGSARSDAYEKQAIKDIVQFLSVLIGSMLASVSFSSKRRISREAIHLLSLCPRSDTSSLLKLASIFYCNGDLHKTESLLTEVADRHHRNDILPVCFCYKQFRSCTGDFALQIGSIEDEDARVALFACCIRFSPHERYCAPPALRHEFCRSVGDDMLHRDPWEDKWMVLATVDCLPFLHYLQYIIYGELGKRVVQTKALQNLENCLLEDKNYGHLETGWNVLGQCMEQEEKLKDAMRCYRMSLKIRPRNNAANWHVQHLRYQLIRKGRSITEI